MLSISIAGKAVLCGNQSRYSRSLYEGLMYDASSTRRMGTTPPPVQRKNLIIPRSYIRYIASGYQSITNHVQSALDWRVTVSPVACLCPVYIRPYHIGAPRFWSLDVAHTRSLVPKVAEQHLTPPAPIRPNTQQDITFLLVGLLAPARHLVQYGGIPRGARACDTASDEHAGVQGVAVVPTAAGHRSGQNIQHGRC